MIHQPQTLTLIHVHADLHPKISTRKKAVNTDLTNTGDVLIQDRLYWTLLHVGLHLLGVGS